MAWLSFNEPLERRPGEVCSMKAGEIDRTGEVWQYRPAQHKTAHHGKQRVIFIGKRAQEVLLPFLDGRPADAFVFQPIEAVAEIRLRRREGRTTPDGYGNMVGSNRKRRPKKMPGARYSNDSFRRAVNRAADLANEKAILDAKKAGREITESERPVPSWNPNQLRHSFATKVRAQFGLEGAQVVLGHSSADITQIYAERDGALAARVAAAVG